MPDPTKTTLLVLGATGKIGTLLRRSWRCPPTWLQPLYQSRDARDGHIQYLPGDDAARIGRVDAVLSLWGVTAGDEAVLADNSRLALAAQQLAEACGAKRVFHASSIAVYSNAAVPLAETAERRPKTGYGRAKCAMEETLQTASGPQRCCLRIGSVAGAESLAAALSSDRDIVLDRFASGKGPLRSYIAANDLAKVIEALCLCPLDQLPEALNIAAPRPLRMEQLLHAAGRDFSWRPAPEGAREIATLDTALLQNLAPLPAASATPARMIDGWLRNPAAAVEAGE